ncbi:hypothetical protein, partial [Streptococcus anginosus]
FKGETEGRINRRLQEALATSLDDFQAYADAIDQVFQEDAWVVIGNQDKIDAAADRFTDRRDLKSYRS